MNTSYALWAVAVFALVGTTLIDLYCSRPMFRLAVGFSMAIWLACIAVGVLK